VKDLLRALGQDANRRKRAMRPLGARDGANRVMDETSLRASIALPISTVRGDASGELVRDQLCGDRQPYPQIMAEIGPGLLDAVQAVANRHGRCPEATKCGKMYQIQCDLLAPAFSSLVAAQ
jgi:hypothetical protein